MFREMDQTLQPKRLNIKQLSMTLTNWHIILGCPRLLYIMGCRIVVTATSEYLRAHH